MHHISRRASPNANLLTLRGKTRDEPRCSNLPLPPNGPGLLRIIIRCLRLGFLEQLQELLGSIMELLGRLGVLIRSLLSPLPDDFLGDNLMLVVKLQDLAAQLHDFLVDLAKVSQETLSACDECHL